MTSQRPTQKLGGLCSYCNQEFARSGMSRHIGSCKARMRGTKDALLIMVQAAYMPTFWLQVLAPVSATLGDLDALLRETWLECCGHMSGFEIGDTRFDADATSGDWGPPTQSMHASRLSSVLPPKTAFTYDYDYGSTTSLKGHCVRVVKDAKIGRKLQVVARNLLPAISCESCGNDQAEVLDIWGETGGLCKPCCTRAIAEETVEEEGIMPVVNSPRMGVCAYGI